ncbi:hypothetical protein GCM10023238_38200 [Streptomyces heliomycini]
MKLTLRPPGQRRGGARLPVAQNRAPTGFRRFRTKGTDAGPIRRAVRMNSKTETTLTTCERINIPGSRPIPPVVRAQPVTTREQGATACRGVGAVCPYRPAADAVEPADTARAADRSGMKPPTTGRATRKSARQGGPVPAPPTRVARRAFGSRRGGASRAYPRRSPAGARPAAGRLRWRRRPTGTPGGSRPGARQVSGAHRCDRRPVAHGRVARRRHRSFDVTEALAAGRRPRRPARYGAGEDEHAP